MTEEIRCHLLKDQKTGLQFYDTFNKEEDSLRKPNDQQTSFTEQMLKPSRVSILERDQQKEEKLPVEGDYRGKEDFASGTSEEL